MKAMNKPVESAEISMPNMGKSWLKCDFNIIYIHLLTLQMSKNPLVLFVFQD